MKIQVIPMATTMTLGDHAEAWWREQGKEVPPRDTNQWMTMYESWVVWAFGNLYRRRKRH